MLRGMKVYSVGHDEQSVWRVIIVCCARGFFGCCTRLREPGVAHRSMAGGLSVNRNSVHMLTYLISC
jgi:hypothetical protein